MKGFSVFGTEHCIWLSIGIISTLWMLHFIKTRPEDKVDRFGLWLSWVPGVSYFLTTLGIIVQDGVDLNMVLPLHLCYFLAFMTPVFLVKRHLGFFQITFFWVMAGCSQSLITPDIANPFPHMHSFRYWLVHISLLQCFIFAMARYKMRPYLKHIFTSILYLDAYVLLILILNYPLGTNFLYLRHKPPVPTMFDYMGDFPWFLLTGQFVAAAMFFLVYLPYFIRDRKLGRIPAMQTVRLEN